MMREREHGQPSRSATTARAVAGACPTIAGRPAGSRRWRDQPLIDFGWILDHLDDIAAADWSSTSSSTIIPVVLGLRDLARPRDLGGPPAAASTARSPRSAASCTRSRASPRSRS